MCSETDAPNISTDVWRMLCLCWHAADDIQTVMPIIYIAPGTSFQRISKDSANLSHPIACFPNSHRTVLVSAGGIARIYDVIRTPSNLASIITSAKIVGLLEMAAYPHDSFELLSEARHMK